MRIVAIESFEPQGSLAILEEKNGNSRLLEAYQLPAECRAAEHLHAQLAVLLERTGTNLNEVAAIGVAAGPGSFTGLRIGVAAAKAFGFAAQIPVYGISSHDAIACDARTNADNLKNANRLWTVINAYRGEVFVCEYTFGGEGREPERGNDRRVAFEAWKKELRQGDLCAGPGVDKVGPQLPMEKVRIIPQREPYAAAVASVTRQSLLDDRPDETWQLTPDYQRRSAAEEKVSSDR